MSLLPTNEESVKQKPFLGPGKVLVRMSPPLMSVGSEDTLVSDTDEGWMQCGVGLRS